MSDTELLLAISAAVDVVLALWVLWMMHRIRKNTRAAAEQAQHLKALQSMEGSLRAMHQLMAAVLQEPQPAAPESQPQTRRPAIRRKPRQPARQHHPLPIVQRASADEAPDFS